MPQHAFFISICGSEKQSDLSSNGQGFAVQDGFDEPIAVVAQLQKEKRRILPQKVKENAIARPFWKCVDKFAAHPLQLALVAVDEIAFKLVRREQVHILALPLTRGQEGHDTAAFPRCQTKPCFLKRFTQEAFIGRFVLLELSADPDPLVLVEVVFFFDTVQHQHVVSAQDVA